MSVFGKSQRYLTVLQKVSDLEMRLESVKTEMERQSLAHQAADLPAHDEEIADEIERRFHAVLRDSIPTLAADVRGAIENEWDLEAVIGKEVFRLLENHLPELTAKELNEEEVAAVTEEVGSRVRPDVEGIVEAKLNQLLPLVEKENAATLMDEFRPRIDQYSEAIRRLWEEVTRVKTIARRMAKSMEALQEAAKKNEAPGGAAMIPEHLMGRASIENLVSERIEKILEESGTERENRISTMEDRLTQISRAFGANEKLLKPTPPSPAPKASPRGKRKARTFKRKSESLDRILDTKLIFKAK